MVTRTIIGFLLSIYFHSGGWDDDLIVRNDILEYDRETKKWTKIATMREARKAHAVSVVEYGDYADFCQ